MPVSSSSSVLEVQSKVLNCSGKKKNYFSSFLKIPIHPLLFPALVLIYLTTHFIPQLYQHKIKQHNQNIHSQSNKPGFQNSNHDYDWPHTESIFFNTKRRKAFCTAPQDQYVCVKDPWEILGIGKTLKNKRHLHKSTGNNVGSSSTDAVNSESSSSTYDSQARMNAHISLTSSRKKNEDNEIAYQQAMQSLSQLNIGVPQRIDGSDSEKEAVKQVMIQTEKYFRSEVMTHPVFYRHVRDLGVCQNTNELCAFWTSVGECESNRGFMLSHCSASCQLCALLFMNLNTMLN